MENQPKTYQLALGYRQYLLHNAKKLGPFTAPPGLPLICYKQFYGRDDSSKNIFYQDEPDRMNSWEIGSLKPYDFVG